MTCFAAIARKHERRSGLLASCWLFCAVVASAVIDVGSATLIAHELGTTRVAILLNDGRTYDVNVITDAAALLEKLEASSGEWPLASLPPERLRARIE